MMVKSQQDFFDDFVTELGGQVTDLNDLNEGSDLDIIGGLVSSAANDVSKTVQDEIRKTFFDTAHGPEITGGPDDLQTLAVDHFGEKFKRPGATKAIGVVTFHRPNADAGDVDIDKDTVIKTEKTSGGTSISVKVVSPVKMIGTTISASVEAVLAGTSGNVNPGTLKVIETALSDPSITVNNNLSLSGGKAAENDTEYRRTIKRLLETLKGATIQAIESAAATVAGVAYATGKEFLESVIRWDIANSLPIGNYFGLPIGKVFVADINGNASEALLDAVRAKIRTVRASGVQIEVVGAQGIELNWAAEVTLNPLGPNYATLQGDLSLIKDAMSEYIQSMTVGQSFYRTAANNYMMIRFGPTGTNDLASFTTGVPSADVALTPGQKLLKGTVTVNGN